MARIFDGVDDEIDIGTDPFKNLTKYTISVWIKNDDNRQKRGICGNWPAATVDKSVLFRLDSTELEMFHQAGGTKGGAFGAFVADDGGVAWRHVVGRYDASELAGFIDGTKAPITHTSVGDTVQSSTTTNCFVGSANSVSGLEIDATLAEVTIWDTDLTDDEITALYNGVHSTRIRRKNIIRYMPLYGNHDPEPDLSGNKFNSVLITGTVKKPHAPIERYITMPQYRPPITIGGLIQVTKLFILKHNIINTIPKNIILKNNMNAAILKNSILKHNIIQAISKSTILKHNIIQAISKNIILKNNIIETINKPVIFKNNIINAINKPVILKHNILSSITSIQKAVTLKHNMINTIQKGIILKNNLNTAVIKSTILKQNILDATQKTIILKQNIIQSIQKEIILKHNIINTIQKIVTFKHTITKLILSNQILPFGNVSAQEMTTIGDAKG